MHNKALKIGSWMLSLVLALALTSVAAPAAKSAKAAAKAPAQAAPAAKAATTLENLQAAYNGESNAHANYLAFAGKADAEGYLKVAALFRAAALAESNHAAKHAKAIKALGAEPVCTLVAAKVGTTQENLEAAIQGETYESTTMYPGFAAQAKAEKNPDQARAFSGTGAVEAAHAKLYAAALADLPAWKKAGDIWVCQVCGNIVDKLDFQYCAICKEPVSVFAKVK